MKKIRKTKTRYDCEREKDGRSLYERNDFLSELICKLHPQKGVNAGKGDGPSAKRMRISTTAAPSHHSDAQAGGVV